MYVGRIVCVARAMDGRLCAAYRVSSRSFPNRTALVHTDKVSIVPKPGHEADVQKNPYIAYNCVRLVADARVAVVTNGSQTDPIAEKIALGMPVRDALAVVSLTMDFEKDQYDTPRISAVVDCRDDSAWLGVIRRDGIEVRGIELPAGRYAYVATYEENTLARAHQGDFTPKSAQDACAFMLRGGIFKDRSNPVSAVAAFVSAHGFELAAQDATET